ncbi:MAG: BrnT family toxin [Acidobacteriaceae bacterium]
MQRIYVLFVDVTYSHDGQLFEWDGEKASANAAKHKVTFEAACEVFLDPFVRLVDASGESEAREAAIGMTEDWSVLFVVHVIRRRAVIRILSARMATAEERKIYEESE